MKRPLIAIPLGDPAGIGPEIVVKALASRELYELSRPLVVGDGRVARQALGFCGLDTDIRFADDPGDGLYNPGTIDLIDLANVDTKSLQIGKVQAMGGRAAFDFIERSVRLALERKADAIATPPISKESLKAAGINYIGHTEILAGLTGTHDPLTLFEVRNLRVFFLTRHVSLRRACDLVTKERLLDYIKRCGEALRRLGINEGTMAVAGLNPHCGEHGLFGDEEVKHIAPAVEEARRQGYDVEGPVSADSVFHLALSGRFNSVLSLYHDQGHIATKTLDFDRTISLTVGLPFLRTSVDHGTAFDIAGTGKAREVSMVEAVKAAAKYAPFYNRD
ncbi:MAG: 4-hydroxythreonine-4-phosphate dehydrogenase PdxA [Clostridiaceae bacterium]|nr:4-hydroxythreonine-4-phosphate dehydrogenase PdxA [Clostridiaceae bacterium]